MSTVNNIIIAGVGGQGTILSSKLIAQVALASGCFVRSAETIGMAQRGGSVVGHVRIAQSEELLHSPLVPSGQAQLIIGFEPTETLRALGYANPHTFVICSDLALAPASAGHSAPAYDGQAELAELKGLAKKGALRMVRVVKSSGLIATAGSVKALNVALLGAACELGLLDIQLMTAALEEWIKPHYLAMNLAAFAYGRQVMEGGIREPRHNKPASPFPKKTGRQPKEYACP